MTSETLNLYEAFCHKMWTANCSERDAYGEPVLRKQEYRDKYEEYLLDEFWLAWGDGQGFLCTKEKVSQGTQL